MGVSVHLENPDDCDAFCSFGSYSIHTVLVSDDVELLTLHDSGASITLVGDDASLDELRRILLEAGMSDVKFDPVQQP